MDTLRNQGIYLPTLQTIRRRLDDMVAAGEFSKDFSDQLYAQSPFHDDPDGGRTGKFWMTSHPLPIDDGGVVELLEPWGGESASFVHRKGPIRETLMRIGRPRVLEVAVPLGATRHSYSAAGAVVATIGRTLGCRPDKGAFDLYSTRPLDSKALLEIHDDRDPTFLSLARGYPEAFVDVRAIDPQDVF